MNFTDTLSAMEDHTPQKIKADSAYYEVKSMLENKIALYEKFHLPEYGAHVKQCDVFLLSALFSSTKKRIRRTIEQIL